MKHKCAIAIFGLLLVCAVLFRIIMHQSKTIKKLEANQPHLLKAEKIDYFKLKGMDDKVIDSDMLNKGENSTFLIYIFSQPCSPCNKNTQVWKKMAALSKQEAKAIGIIIDDHQEALAFSEKLKPNFQLYVPVDIPKFKDKMKIRTNFAQTILYHDGKVIFIKLGMLQGEDYTHILSTIKHLKQ